MDIWGTVVIRGSFCAQQKTQLPKEALQMSVWEVRCCSVQIPK